MANSNQQLLDEWYKQQNQQYGNLTQAQGGVSNTGVGDQMMSQYYQLQNNMSNPGFQELLDYASQNVGGDINAAIANQKMKQQQQAALDQWARNQQGSASNLTQLGGGIANTGIGDQIGSEYARLQNAIGASNRDYASLLGGADQMVGQNILGSATNLLDRQKQQQQLDQWAKQQQGSASGLTQLGGGIADTRIGDKIGSTYAQLQNAINDPKRNADFNSQLGQASSGIQKSIQDVTPETKARGDALRKAAKEGEYHNSSENSAFMAPLLGMALMGGLGGLAAGGLGSLGLGSTASGILGQGLASGAMSSAMGGEFGKGALGGMIGAGVGAGTNFIGDAVGLGNGLGGQLAKGAIGGGLTSAVRGGNIGQGALGGAIGSGVNYGVNAAGNALGLGKDPLGQAGRGAIGGAVNAGIRGGDIGQGALQGGIMGGVNAVSPAAGTALKYANMYNQAQQRQQAQQRSAPSRAGFQQWAVQNKIKDPGTPEGRQAIMAQYRKSLG